MANALREDQELGLVVPAEVLRAQPGLAQEIQELAEQFGTDLKAHVPEM